MTLPVEQSVIDIAREIELAIFDVDGVLTDGRLYFGSSGEALKVFHSHDGHGLVMLNRVIDLAVITGRQSKAVEIRMQQLGITRVYQGHSDKLPVFEALLDELNIAASRVCYVGDDIPDIAIMRAVGLPIAVNDAVPQVRARAAWCTQRAGGRGAVREVCDLLLSARGVLEEMAQDYRGATDSGSAPILSGQT